MPDPDIALGKHPIEHGSDGFDGFRKQTAQGEHDIMLSAIADDSMCECQGVSTNTASATG
jgi:hypothetical protein